MNDDNVVKVLCDRFQIDGHSVFVFECGVPPLNEYGDADLGALAHRTFATADNDKHVYYEANDTDVKWFKGPFWVGKTSPSQEELRFQLHKWHQERQRNFIIGAVIAVVIIFFMIK